MHEKDAASRSVSLLAQATHKTQNERRYDRTSNFEGEETRFSASVVLLIFLKLVFVRNFAPERCKVTK
jgi:hypothetical protein